MTCGSRERKQNPIHRQVQTPSQICSHADQHVPPRRCANTYIRRPTSLFNVPTISTPSHTIHGRHHPPSTSQPSTSHRHAQAPTTPTVTTTLLPTRPSRRAPAYSLHSGVSIARRRQDTTDN
ncbi:hypothetical protein BV25DRAFT_1536010 [Artomyces pyxidatus]|uniref:Uncharacterized protein n=1 Tax=Artomyces pyxidatus TaxID=48021 RepID=A0ACB8SKT4_9AGAM|nr:hypothetical protein BV25DRAFT_1536010 [Artomyces pyxidatus]